MKQGPLFYYQIRRTNIVSGGFNYFGLAIFPLHINWPIFFSAQPVLRLYVDRKMFPLIGCICKTRKTSSDAEAFVELRWCLNYCRYYRIGVIAYRLTIEPPNH